MPSWKRRNLKTKIRKCGHTKKNPCSNCKYCYELSRVYDYDMHTLRLKTELPEWAKKFVEERI